jgi:U3 small nucleolar RNA-associated protein 21
MNSAIFEPYRTLGLVCGHQGFKWHREGEHSFLTFAVGKSYLTYYADSLKIRYLGPQLLRQVNSIDSYRDLILAAEANQILAFHKVKLARTYSGSASALSEIFVFGEYVLGLNFGGELLVWNGDNAELVHTIGLSDEAIKIVHPPTYLNKVIVATKHAKLYIVNIKTGRIIYDFPKIREQLNAEICSLTESPALDIVTVGLENGRILVINVLTDSLIFELEQTTPVTSLSFCTAPNRNKLATGCTNGQVLVWDLDTQRLSSTINAHEGNRVDQVMYLPGEPVLVSSSGSDNSIKQWLFEHEDPEPRQLKHRSGFNSPPSLVKFYNDYHILASSSKSLRDLSLLNEHQSIELSSRYIHKSIRGSRVQFKINPFLQLAFSQTRETDWSNILTCQKAQDIPLFWSFENKVLSERPVEQYYGNIHCTAVDVSPCGNFGVVGLKNGYLEKFNMQSGLHGFVFNGKHDGDVVGVKIDAYNRIMVSCAQNGELYFWNFLTGSLQNELKLAKRIHTVELDRNSNILSLGTDKDITLIDIRNRNIIREFDCKDSVSLSFSNDSRWIGACSGNDIFIYDIPSDRLVEWLTFKKKPTALAFSPQGDTLATTHEGSYGVFLWLNKGFYENVILDKIPTTPCKLKGFDIKQGKEFYSRKKVSIEKLRNLDEVEHIRPEVVVGELPALPVHESVKLSELPFHRVQALYTWDTIKERNKPIDPPKKPDNIPFFLPDTLNIVKAPDAIGEEKKPVRVIKSSESESELSIKLHLSHKSTLTYLKELPPGKIELSLWELDEDDIDEFTKFLSLQIQSRANFEFIQSILACFLKVIFT